MKDNRNNQHWEEHKNQTPHQKNDARGSKEETTGRQNPDNRLEDGTNDFQNRDQNESSERTSDLDHQSPEV